MTAVRTAATFIAIRFLGQAPATPPTTIPAPVVARLVPSLAAATPHAKSVWRDVPPFNADGTLNAYLEIARGDRRTWELDIARHNLHEPGKFSRVPGWGTADEGAAIVRTTHAFFRKCRGAAPTACPVAAK